jgi:membrane protease YdiL (CAAX protease family)
MFSLLSAERNTMIQSQEPLPVTASLRWLPAAFAWAAVLCASDIVDIIFRNSPYESVLVPGIKIAGLLVLLICTLKWPVLKPLRGVMLALLATVVGWNILRSLLIHSDAWIQWEAHAPLWMQLIADQLARLIPIPLLMLTLIGSGLSRQDLFLTRGISGKASIQFLKRWGINYPFTWRMLAIAFVVIAGVVLPLYLTLTMHINMGVAGRLLINAPAILLAAALNAPNEEFEFRALLLARLIPVVGERQALWLTVTIFGLGHYYGQPSGVVGVLLAGLAGWLWGVSMLETKGWRWAVTLHFIQDVVILSFVVLATR